MVVPATMPRAAIMAMATIVLVVPATIVVTVTVVLPATMPAAPPARMLCLVALTNPGFLYEVHRLAASVVAPAVTAPILLMRCWHVEIDRRSLHWRGGNDHRLGKNQSGSRKITNVDAAVDARLVDADRHADTGLRVGGTQRTDGEHQSQNLFHCVFQFQEC